jgi:hypothetical protein
MHQKIERMTPQLYSHNLLLLQFFVASLVSMVTSYTLDRRSMLESVVSGSFALSFATTDPLTLVARMDATLLQQPPSTNADQRSYVPEWMAGTWTCAQQLVDVQTPLGLKFAGGPNGREDIAAKSLAESKLRLYRPVTFQLRWETTPLGVVEDRLFNTKQRLDAFAGRSVVASVDYAKKKKILGGGPQDAARQTTIVRFKGPAVQKCFVTSHGSAYLSPNNNNWIGYEGQRSIFELINQQTAPPIVTDSELLLKLDRIDENHVQGRLRIAGYLNAQSDMLYFEAKQRAVSIQEYTLDLTRISNDARQAALSTPDDRYDGAI